MVFMHQYVYPRNKLGYQLFSLHILMKTKQYLIMILDRNKTFIPTLYSEFGKRAIKYKGSKLWNDLPDDLKGIESPYSFIRKLKEHFLQLS